MAVAEGSDARLPCVSDANPCTEFTNWTRHGKDVRSARFAVLEKGALLIQDVRRTDAGEYACTPYNKVGAGKTKITKLVLKGKSFPLCRDEIRPGLHLVRFIQASISVTKCPLTLLLTSLSLRRDVLTI